jgi:sec-independent protein translocase protein TatA
MFGLGAGEILVISLMAIIFIGPKKLPELSRTLGKTLRELNKAKEGVMDSLKDGYDGAGPDDDESTTAEKSTASKPEIES